MDINQGYIYLRDEKPKKAISFFKSFIKEHSNDENDHKQYEVVSAHLELAYLYTAKLFKHNKQFLENVNVVINSSYRSLFPEADILKGLYYYRKKNLFGALSHYQESCEYHEKALSSIPQDIEGGFSIVYSLVKLLSVCGICHMELGQFDKARDCYKRALMHLEKMTSEKFCQFKVKILVSLFYSELMSGRHVQALNILQIQLLPLVKRLHLTSLENQFKNLPSILGSISSFSEDDNYIVPNTLQYFLRRCNEVDIFSNIKSLRKDILSEGKIEIETIVKKRGELLLNHYEKNEMAHSPKKDSLEKLRQIYIGFTIEDIRAFCNQKFKYPWKISIQWHLLVFCTRLFEFISSVIILGIVGTSLLSRIIPNQLFLNLLTYCLPHSMLNLKNEIAKVSVDILIATILFFIGDRWISPWLKKKLMPQYKLNLLKLIARMNSWLRVRIGTLYGIEQDICPSFYTGDISKRTDEH